MKNFLSAAAFALSGLLFAQGDAEIVEQTVDKNEIEGHIYFLADDVLKGRATGSPELKIAASYLANTLRGYGVKPHPATNSYFQTFNLLQTAPPDEIKVSLNGEVFPHSIAVEAKPTTLSGDALYVGYGTEDDYKGKDVQGKLVLAKAGTSESADARAIYRAHQEKQDLAIKNGAIGLLEMTLLEEDWWSRMSHFMGESVKIPDAMADQNQKNGFIHLWVNTTSEKLEALIKSNPSYSIETDGKKEKTLVTQNVIGVLEGTDPKLKDEYIMYSAHYDHVGVGTPNAEGDSIYNGARDNAIGTTAVLSMAENIGKYPTKRSAVFILFTGEEKGLLGSKYYAEHPIFPLNQIVYGFNTDGAGYNNTKLATVIGLNRTTAKKHIVAGAATFGLEAIDDPAPEQGLFDRSDNVSFASKGVPAPTYSTGFDAFDDEINKYYHQAADEAESLDFDYLVKFYQGYVLSGRLIANDPETPYWVKGDKYEAAGNVLYDKVPKAPMKN
ncbi:MULTISPECIES: M28 family peptidase [Maribacter]|uniref:M28 family peptidase n=1 Tax=Maribacter flavus TaxID=1658664 RepID=A0ABU7IJD6_9FLAO|nr:MULTISPECIES: M28 family peptidase [Maribacter]MDC6406133.1 M28 family peptidase [Maribacter sp. PR66]MEE1973082.1 M28 family peptidase [Maribacter flavus]